MLAQFGVKGADFGDPSAQIHAVVDDLNKRGGILGRKIVPAIRDYDALSTDDDATQYTALCQGFTQDDHVFAVLAPWNPDPSFAPCLAKAHTLYVDDALLQEDAETMTQLSPYVSSGLYSVSRGSIAYARGLADSGFFPKGIKLGLVRFDLPEFQRVSDKYFKPALRSVGVTNIDEVPVNRGDEQAINSAVLKLKTDNADRIVFLDAAGGTALFFMSFAESQGYHPLYGLASWDGPSVLAQNAPSTQLAGAKGVGWIPAVDVLDADGPPLTAQENRCLAINAAEGTTYSGRNAATTALDFCDLMWLFEEAAAKAGKNLTRLGWARALGTIGVAYRSAVTYGTNFVASRHDGATQYRTLAYSTAGNCNCFKYTSGPKTTPA
jgi:ABC-type branched-subunit amino acid transport system substrate-binding protein